MPEPKESTALVTGASSGIGEAFARRLAADGCNLIITARRKALLEALAEELSRKYGVEVEVVAADLTSDEDISRLESIVASRQLDFLINNAGFSISGSFIEIDIERQIDIVKVHNLALMRLTHAALPGMTSRGGGAVINISSIGGIIPVPYSVTYDATKAFVITFSEALHQELAGTGVRVQALCPGYTHTGFHAAMGEDRRVPEFMWMSADAVVDASLAALESGRVVVVPGLLNRFNVLMMSLTPRPLKYFILRFVERRSR